MVADYIASQIYAILLEESWNKGELPLPRNAPNFYEGMNKEAYCACTWIGASRGQVDELKETQAAVMRINSHLSTLEDEAGKLGKDWRELLQQKAREKKYADKLGLSLEPVPAVKPGGNAAKNTMDNGTNPERKNLDEGNTDE